MRGDGVTLSSFDVEGNSADDRWLRLIDRSSLVGWPHLFASQWVFDLQPV